MNRQLETPNGSAPPRRAILVADPGDGLRWLGWSRGWNDEAAAAAAVERLETLSVSRQITDVAGFLRSEDGSWIVSRGGLMPESDPGHRYWREALLLSHADLERIRANPFRVMPRDPPPSPERSLGVELPPVAVPAPATAEMDSARVRELRTRPWGRASWNIETLLAAALDVEHTLITGSAVSLAALELLILLLPPSLRPEFTFHTYALAEPRKPVPRLVFTQFEDDWLFPETAAFGHRLPATELRITKRARNAASELLGLLDTPDRLAEAHASYESLAAHVVPAERVLLREIETVLSLARMLAVREHGHPGAGIRVLEQELARIGPVDWLAPESREPEQIRIEVLTGLLLDAFTPRAIGAAVVDAIQGGHEAAVPLQVVRRFLDRHPAGSPEADRFAHPFARLPLAAWPAVNGEESRKLRDLIESIVPTPEQTPAEPATDWPDESVPDLGEVSAEAADAIEIPAPPSADEADVSPVLEDGPEMFPEAEVLRSIAAGLAREAATTPDKAEEVVAKPKPPSFETIRDRLHETALLNESREEVASRRILEQFLDSERRAEADAEDAVQTSAAEPAAPMEQTSPAPEPAQPAALEASAPEPVQRAAGETPLPVEPAIEEAPAQAPVEPAEEEKWADVPVAGEERAADRTPRAPAIDPAHARFAPRAQRMEADAEEPRPAEDDTPEVPAAAEPAPPAIVGPISRPEEEARKGIRLPRRAAAVAAGAVVLLALSWGARAYLFGGSAGGSPVTVADANEVSTQPATPAGPVFAFEERVADARLRAAERDWAGVRDAMDVTFASLSSDESFQRDSLLANATLELARTMTGNNTERTRLFVNVFDHTSRALAAVAPFAPGTDALRLMQAEACLEGALDCDSGEVVGNLVLAVRSSSARIRGRASELLTRTSPVGHDAAVLVSSDGGPGRL